MNFDDLAAFTLHDVKNRLAVLAGRAEQGGDVQTVRTLHETAATLTRLLAYYRAANGSLDISVDAHSPGDLLEDLAADIGQQTPLAVRTDAQATPALWFYDEGLVRMVLVSALHNAMRHARQGVLLKAQAGGGWLAIEVRDDGPGYPQAMLDDPGSVRPLSADGTGLGLHLAGRVAALHRHGGRQGRIELQNDGGALFRLLLPG